MDRRFFLKLFGTTTTAGLVAPSELLAMTQQEKNVIAGFLGHDFDMKTNIASAKQAIIQTPQGFNPLPNESAKETLALLDKFNKQIIDQNKFQKNTDISRLSTKYYSNYNERKLNLYNIHTGESFNDVFWANGKYDLEALAKIDRLLRDHRQNQATEMKLAAIEGIYRMQKVSDKRKPLIINSAYRTQKTNTMLRNKGVGVAKYSMHLTGAALDFTVDKKSRVPLKTLANYAKDYHVGGVGYYRRSHFVHIDGGPNRRWNI